MFFQAVKDLMFCAKILKNTQNQNFKFQGQNCLRYVIFGVERLDFVLKAEQWHLDELHVNKVKFKHAQTSY